MRALYLIMGVALIIQAILAKQYMLVALGGYFSAMSVFGIGCAGGRCAVPPPSKKQTTYNEDVTFEEVK